jgi:transcriptional activator of cad operon
VRRPKRVSAADPPCQHPLRCGQRAVRRKRLTTALVWGLFLLALGTCVALVALSSMESRPPVNKARLLLNPRDIDIHLVNGNSCTNWSSQHSMRLAWPA